MSCSRRTIERENRREAKTREDKRRKDLTVEKIEIAYAILKKHNADTTVNRDFVKYAIGAETTWASRRSLVESSLQQKKFPAHGLYRSFHHLIRSRSRTVHHDSSDVDLSVEYLEYNKEPSFNISPEVAACIACYLHISNSKYRYELCKGLATLLEENVRITAGVVDYIVENPELPLEKNFLQKIRSLKNSTALLASLHPRPGSQSILGQLARRSSIFDHKVLGLPLELANENYRMPVKK